jgi:hypothetical protein
VHDGLVPRERSPEPQLTGLFARWRWPFILAAVIAIGTGSVLVGSYLTYHEWPWSTYPKQLHACGRDFESSEAAETRSQIAVHDPSSLVRVGDVPGWLTRGELWAYANEQPFSGGCRVVMFVRGSADQFKSYELLGGP